MRQMKTFKDPKEVRNSMFPWIFIKVGAGVHTSWINFYLFKAHVNVHLPSHTDPYISLFQVHIDAIKRSLHFCNCEEFQLCIIKHSKALTAFQLQKRTSALVCND